MHSAAARVVCGVCCHCCCGVWTSWDGVNLCEHAPSVFDNPDYQAHLLGNQFSISVPTTSSMSFPSSSQSDLLSRSGWSVVHHFLQAYHTLEHAGIRHLARKKTESMSELSWEGSLAPSHLKPNPEHAGIRHLARKKTEPMSELSWEGSLALSHKSNPEHAGIQHLAHKKRITKLSRSSETSQSGDFQHTQYNSNQKSKIKSNSGLFTRLICNNNYKLSDWANCAISLTFFIVYAILLSLIVLSIFKNPSFNGVLSNSLHSTHEATYITSVDILPQCYSSRLSWSQSSTMSLEHHSQVKLLNHPDAIILNGIVYVEPSICTTIMSCDIFLSTAVIPISKPLGSHMASITLFRRLSPLNLQLLERILTLLSYDTQLFRASVCKGISDSFCMFRDFGTPLFLNQWYMFYICPPETVKLLVIHAYLQTLQNTCYRHDFVVLIKYATSSSRKGLSFGQVYRDATSRSISWIFNKLHARVIGNHCRSRTTYHDRGIIALDSVYLQITLLKFLQEHILTIYRYTRFLFNLFCFLSDVSPFGSNIWISTEYIYILIQSCIHNVYNTIQPRLMYHIYLFEHAIVCRFAFLYCPPLPLTIFLNEPKIITHIQYIGGGSQMLDPTSSTSVYFSGLELARFRAKNLSNIQAQGGYKFHSHIPLADSILDLATSEDLIAVQVPVQQLCTRLPKKVLIQIAQDHEISFVQRTTLGEIQALFLNHVACMTCTHYTTIYQYHSNIKRKPINAEKKKEYVKNKKLARIQKRRATVKAKILDNLDLKHQDKSFPPTPHNRPLLMNLIGDFIKETSMSNISEVGCRICAMLTPMKTATLYTDAKINWSLLQRAGQHLTRIKRISNTEDILEETGPIIDPKCTYVCPDCLKRLSKRTVPLLSLANGNWIGDVPSELQGLSYAEKLLVARIRKNYCVVRVRSGFHKMRANAVLFPNPMVKIYKSLPPHRDELDQVLAFIFTGPTRPGKPDLQRTPLLVRNRKVRAALDWLKLNHEDYSDLDISEENLASYADDEIPVPMEYHQTSSNKDAQSTSLYDDEPEEGTSEGPCPFTVNGLVGDELPIHSTDQLITLALQHLHSNGKVLAVGQSDQPASIYDNPQLYPQVFPWLFPYGLGGIGNLNGEARVPDHVRIKQLLMHHDKRFQTDPDFPLVAFNHRQIKASSVGSFLLAEKENFGDIANRLLNINLDVLTDLAERGKVGDSLLPQTQEEKNIYKIITDLDHVSSKVEGSGTTRKFMRNELWSLLSYLGAPTWYITFAPADVKHPIAIYLAESNLKIRPELPKLAGNTLALADNPVASARFFNILVQAFIKHVLQVNQKEPGLYGNTSGYYGTVEQQGRLTLHLHLMLWIANSLTPQEIRDRILDSHSKFQSELVEYLESCHKGEFITGTMDEVRDNINNAEAEPAYLNPTMTLPESPPKICMRKGCKSCQRCMDIQTWWQKFEQTVDDLVFRSNRHTHSINSCLKNAWKACKARFPRTLYRQTEVDAKSGHLNMKKGEAWINTFSPVLTYLLRCNTDVTSLLSGTSIKAVIAYVTDYISKSPLKTYGIFESIKTVLDRNAQMLGGDKTRNEKARKLLTSIVNSLTTKMEIGSPMASAYILEQPDHYTSHRFKPFYWRPYVRAVINAWPKDDTKSTLHDTNIPNEKEKVLVTRSGDGYIGYSNISDYMLRPIYYEKTTLYEWMTRAQKKKGDVKLPLSDKDEDLTDVENDYDDENLPENEALHSLSETENESCDDSEDELVSPSMKTKKRKILEMLDEDSVITLDQMKFLVGHPQRNSHRINMVEATKCFVPNFLGGPLPRHDKGDREYYCATMLTLFLPWRTGLELKQPNQNWDQAFLAHKFTSRDQELMKFFYIRYECNDARDDFRANRNNKGDTFIGADLDAEWIEDSEELDIQNQLYDQLNDESLDYQDIIGLGSKTIKKHTEMKNAEDIARSTGWLDDCIDMKPIVESTPIEIDPSIQASQWRTLLETEKDKRATDRMMHSVPQSQVITDEITQSSTVHISSPDEVKVVDASYLLKDFKAKVVEAQQQTTAIVNKFHLNQDQERAFRIIANHTVQPSGEQLKMYLGGMAGTGKSQVFKALAAFFEACNESHRFQMVAPTGSAAVLVGGTTWHALLNVPPGYQGGPISMTALSNIKLKLGHTDYLLLDEVSMLNCRELYFISRILCQVLNKHDIPFGGMNLILCRDFAQLPPVKMNALYTYKWCSKYTVGSNNYTQESTIGQVLWHQFTTVVILRENMRQTTQTSEDAKLRKALENMRYKSCTDSDIKYLTSLSAGRSKHKKKLNQRRFRNISVIVGRNAHRDKWNTLGIERFAKENNVEIHDFLSIDILGNKPIDNGQRQRKAVKDPKRKHNVIPPSLQHILWNLPHEASNHFAGKLRLCIGLPVMIKKNIATECCVTNGAEGIVSGWVTTPISPTANALKILFVKLQSPPKAIQLPGLPMNVVPIYRTTESTPCQLPSDDILYITRSQVQVLPNFAMTDFASQGRTRPDNVIDLGTCRSHMSYYTALSRSASSEGTIIVQGFDARKVQGGAAADLRQEFRELEILDEITKLRYHSTLPSRILGHRRGFLIQEYQLWKGISHLPKTVHPTLRWKIGELPVLQDISEIESWRIVEHSKKKVSNSKIGQNEDYDDTGRPTKRTNISDQNFIPAQGSKPLEKLSEDQGRGQSKKHKLTESKSLTLVKKSKVVYDINAKHSMFELPVINKYIKDTKKYIKLTSTQQTSIASPAPSQQDNLHCENIPIGPRWNNNSCAYDSLLSIMYNIFRNDMNGSFSHDATLNPIWAEMINDFRHVLVDQLSIDQARDNFRSQLQILNPDHFVTPNGMVSIADIVCMIETLNKDVRQKTLQCLKCETNYGSRISHTVFSEYMEGRWCLGARHFGLPDDPTGMTVQTWTEVWNCLDKLNRVCDTCPSHEVLTDIQRWISPPSCFIIDVSHASCIVISKILQQMDTENKIFSMKISGIIYLNLHAQHFYSRIIDENGNIWLSDGLQGMQSMAEGKLENITEEDLSQCRGGIAFCLVYTKI